MQVSSATLAYFSPTHTTKKVLEGIVRGMQLDRVEHLDVTLPGAGAWESKGIREGSVLIGAPVYGGRIPADAAHRLRRLKGNDNPAVVVVVYGNRAYEDALLELRDLAIEVGFVPVAGGAFIGEHSFSTEAKPIAGGRPDVDDLNVAAAFGKLIRGKLQDTGTPDEITPLQVPGNYPYQEGMESWGISPLTLEARCITCGQCADACPTAAVAVRDTVETDPDLCILCCACVRNCPTGARVFEHPRIKRSVAWLSTNCRERQEPELYI